MSPYVAATGTAAALIHWAARKSKDYMLDHSAGPTDSLALRPRGTRVDSDTAAVCCAAAFSKPASVQAGRAAVNPWVE